MDKLQTMRVFTEVAECQSFVAASRKLNLSAPAATRAIAQLEHTMGVRLFNRTTRSVRLTDAGKRYYDDARQILDLVEQAESTASGVYTKPKGVLSVTAPVMFGQKYIAPLLAEYLQQNPAVDVNALFYDRVCNILDEGLDVAIRIGHLQDSSLYATQVGTIRQVVCGSPSYFEQHGKPDAPTDLVKHSVIQAPIAESSATWRFDSGKSKTTVKVSPRLHCNQNGAAISAAKSGFGITRLMSYQVGEEFEEGSLVRVLQDYESEPLPINIVYIDGRKANAKVRAFVDLAVEQLRQNPFINYS
ncbi:LysR family transcriptional regulator [bacterium SCSIO 12696]|nr:LysR family transcriptional regulator [bacterium SCSIO 12696]